MFITIQDVKSYSSMASNAPDCSIKTIELTENSLFLNELKEIKSKLDETYIQYDNVAKYDNTHTYSKGDVCVYDGVIKRAKEPVTGVRPDVINKWELAPKFSDECVNKMWCDYIAPVIAHGVVKNDIPLINAIADRSGGGSYVAHKVIGTVQEQANRMFSIALNTLREYVKQHKDNCLNLTPTGVGCKAEKKETINTSDWATKFG